MDTKALTEIILPVALGVAAVGLVQGTMALGLQSGEVAHVDARRVGAYACLYGIGLPGCHDGALQGVETDDGALALVPLPGTDAQGRDGGVDADRQSLARGDGGHHLEAFILHIVEVEIVLQFLVHSLRRHKRVRPLCVFFIGRRHRRHKRHKSA